LDVKESEMKKGKKRKEEERRGKKRKEEERRGKKRKEEERRKQEKKQERKLLHWVLHAPRCRFVMSVPVRMRILFVRRNQMTWWSLCVLRSLHTRFVLPGCSLLLLGKLRSHKVCTTGSM
jgi:replicative superfamily II helicase